MKEQPSQPRSPPSLFFVLSLLVPLMGAEISKEDGVIVEFEKRSNLLFPLSCVLAASVFSRFPHFV